MEGKNGGKKNKREEEIDGYSFEKLFKALGELELLIPELDLSIKYHTMVNDLRINGKSVKGYPSGVFALQETGNKDILIELMTYIGIDVGFGTERPNLSDIFYNILDGKKSSKSSSESDDDLGYMDSDDENKSFSEPKERRVYDTDSDEDVDPDTASYSDYGLRDKPESSQGSKSV